MSCPGRRVTRRESSQGKGRDSAGNNLPCPTHWEVRDMDWDRLKQRIVYTEQMVAQAKATVPVDMEDLAYWQGGRDALKQIAQWQTEVSNG